MSPKKTARGTIEEHNRKTTGRNDGASKIITEDQVRSHGRTKKPKH